MFKQFVVLKRGQVQSTEPGYSRGDPAAATPKLWTTILGIILANCFGWTTVFAVFGLIAWLVSGDAGLVGPLALFGAVAGLLFGVGNLVIKALR
jgi:hypothetical protein